MGGRGTDDNIKSLFARLADLNTIFTVGVSLIAGLAGACRWYEARYVAPLAGVVAEYSQPQSAKGATTVPALTIRRYEVLNPGLSAYGCALIMVVPNKFSSDKAPPEALQVVPDVGVTSEYLQYSGNDQWTECRFSPCITNTIGTGRLAGGQRFGVSFLSSTYNWAPVEKDGPSARVADADPVPASGPFPRYEPRSLLSALTAPAIVVIIVLLQWLLFHAYKKRVASMCAEAKARGATDAMEAIRASAMAAENIQKQMDLKTNAKKPSPKNGAARAFAGPQK